MTGIDRISVATHLIRMINLVAFDVCDTEEIVISQPADPLSFIIKCPLREAIHKALHPHIRKGLKQEARARDMLIGRVSLEHEISITVYQKTLRKPAYIHEDESAKKSEITS